MTSGSAMFKIYEDEESDNTDYVSDNPLTEIGELHSNQRESTTETLPHRKRNTTPQAERETTVDKVVETIVETKNKNSPSVKHEASPTLPSESEPKHLSKPRAPPSDHGYSQADRRGYVAWWDNNKGWGQIIENGTDEARRITYEDIKPRYGALEPGTLVFYQWFGGFHNFWVHQGLRWITYVECPFELQEVGGYSQASLSRHRLLKPGNRYTEAINDLKKYPYLKDEYENNKRKSEQKAIAHSNDLQD